MMTSFWDLASVSLEEGFRGTTRKITRYQQKRRLANDARQVDKRQLRVQVLPKPLRANPARPAETTKHRAVITIGNLPRP